MVSMMAGKVKFSEAISSMCVLCLFFSSSRTACIAGSISDSGRSSKALVCAGLASAMILIND